MSVGRGVLRNGVTEILAPDAPSLG